MIRSAAAEQRRQVAIAGHRADEATARGALLADDEHTRAGALTALNRMTSLRIDDLDTALADTSPTVRRRACELAATFEIDLVSALDDSDPTVVEAAAWACGEHQSHQEPVVTRLIAISAGHADALCRESAVAALGAIGHLSGLPAILAALRDKATVRRRAVLALAPFDGPEIDAALRHALEDRDWQVRQAAEDMLG